MHDPSPKAPDAIQRHRLLDVCVDCATMQQALAAMERFVAERGPHHVVTLDASMCVAARTDLELRHIVLRADLVTPDSAGVLWAARRTGAPLQQRVSGVEIVERLAEMSALKGISLYLLGSAPGVAEEAAVRMRERCRGCRIVGTHHGYFGPSDEGALIEDIRAAAPDVLCVALGIPKQERWIAAHREALGVPVMIGVGGTLDVLSGRVRRAPLWMQRRGLEWVYRLMSNPRKIRKVLSLPRFMMMVLARARSE